MHNLRLAIILCLNAGFTNAAGFLAFNVLTTNVTGHAALLAVDVAERNLTSARMVILWLFLFLAGAFVSSLYISLVGKTRTFAYTVPVLFIMTILLFIAMLGHTYDHSLAMTGYFAGSLLFAMGMQNALVSVISGSEVRTTHLTGMFTDLGIDLSAAMLSPRQVIPAIRRRVALKIAIILFFLLGGILGGILFLALGFAAFYVPVGILATALCYEYFRVKVTRAITKGRRMKM